MEERMEQQLAQERHADHHAEPAPGLQHQQLDFLYDQLDVLKQSMVEKQSSLANVSHQSQDGLKCL